MWQKNRPYYIQGYSANAAAVTTERVRGSSNICAGMSAVGKRWKNIPRKKKEERRERGNLWHFFIDQVMTAGRGGVEREKVRGKKSLLGAQKEEG